MPNYQNAKIYKIVSNQSEKVYIGSTVQKLCQRKGGHMRDFREWKINGSEYVTSFEILKYDDADVILLEKFPCNSKEELEARERYYIETLNCVNKSIPQRNQKEYYNDHRDRILEYKKAYGQQNKTSINLKQRERYEQNKEKFTAKQREKILCKCGAIISYGSTSKHLRSNVHNNNLATKKIPIVNI